jgi:hypothetical protein
MMTVKPVNEGEIVPLPHADCVLRAVTTYLEKRDSLPDAERQVILDVIRMTALTVYIPPPRQT